MWWCTAHDGATVNREDESSTNGNFWLVCDRTWSKHSLHGKLLAISDLPGTVTTTAGFKGTICTPKNWPTILRLIRDERDPDCEKAAAARDEYMQAVNKLVKRLSPQDFEQLIDLILTRTGWVRIG